MWKTSILNNGEKGITLVEVLFSAAIIALVMVGALLIFVYTVDISRRIDYEYTATNLAKSRLERAKRIIEVNGFSSLPAMEETELIDMDSDGADDFKRVTEVTANYGTPANARLTKVRVSVVYKFRDAWRDDSATVIETIFGNFE